LVRDSGILKNMQAKVYFDTDCFHHFAKTFQSTPLPDDLRDKILLSPVTMIEVLSHLARHWGPDVLQQVKGMTNWLNAQHVGVLPFMDEAISIIGFGDNITEDGYTDHLQADMNTCVDANLDELHQVANERDAELIKMKDFYIGTFQGCVDYFRSTKLTEAKFTQAWLSRYHNNDAAKDHPKTDEHLVKTFSAVHEYEYEKLKLAVNDLNYKAANHGNDLFDAEQLIYLGDSNFHFITLDKGYLLKVLKSPQRSRIHQVKAAQLDDPESAEALIREILK
jgi:hypothetical protein